MQILIIGAQGMLGRPVARRLLQDGLQVKALARRPEAARRLLPPQVTVVAGDLEQVDSIAAALTGCQAVYVSVETFPGARYRPETDGLLQCGQRRAQRPRSPPSSAVGFRRVHPSGGLAPL